MYFNDRFQDEGDEEYKSECDDYISGLLWAVKPGIRFVRNSEDSVGIWRLSATMQSRDSDGRLTN